MRYRNSECCLTPEEASQETIRTECNGCDNNWNKPMEWNKKDGWTMRDRYDDNDNWYRKDKCDKDKKEKYESDWNKKEKCDDHDGCSEDLMRRLTELKFAAIDLNLYLDTHPCDEEALEMFKKISKTIESAKKDYIRKYGPLMAWDSSDDTLFQWASCEFKWPWEK